MFRSRVQAKKKKKERKKKKRKDVHWKPDPFLPHLPQNKEEQPIPPEIIEKLHSMHLLIMLGRTSTSFLHPFQENFASCFTTGRILGIVSPCSNSNSTPSWASLSTKFGSFSSNNRATYMMIIHAIEQMLAKLSRRSSHEPQTTFNHKKSWCLSQWGS